MTTEAPPAPPTVRYHPAGFVLPAFWSPQTPGARTRGGKVAAFAEKHLTITKGPRVGHPLRLLKWQRWLVDEVLSEKPDGGLRHRRALAGIARQNGKSFAGVPLALWHVFEGGPPGAEAYAVAGDRAQARIIFDEARRQVQGSRSLSQHATVYRDAIEVHSTGSIFRTLSSDGRLAQGLSPSFVTFDEVHVQKDDELWDAMTLGTGARPEAIVLGITTAGSDPESLAGRLYEYGRQVAAGETDDPSFGFWWWQAPDGCDLHDIDAWHAANPSLYEGITVLEDLEVAARQQNPIAFRRYRLNQWIRHGGAGWMDMTAFDEATTDEPPPEPNGKIPVVAAFDGSVDRDATALTLIDVDPDDDEAPIAHLYGIWEPPPKDSGAAEGWQVPRTDVHATIDRLFAEYDVRALVCDPAWWRTEIQEWRERYGEDRVIDWPVTNARMGPATASAYARILGGDLRIAADTTLRRHVANAVAKDLPGGTQTIRKDRPNSSRRIDAAVTLIMAVDALERWGAKPPPPPTLITF